MSTFITFGRLAGGRHSIGELLVAADGPHAGDREVLDAFDELARALFEAGRTAQARADALAGALWDAFPGTDTSEPVAWSWAGARRAAVAAPALRAAVGLELGRRAGFEVRALRLASGWALVVSGEEEARAVDVGAGASGAPGGRCGCPHQLIFTVLSGRAGALLARGRVGEACEVGALRLHLPIDAATRRSVEAQLAQWRRR